MWANRTPNFLFLIPLSLSERSGSDVVVRARLRLLNLYLIVVFVKDNLWEREGGSAILAVLLCNQITLSLSLSGRGYGMASFLPRACLRRKLLQCEIRQIKQQMSRKVEKLHPQQSRSTSSVWGKPTQRSLLRDERKTGLLYFTNFNIWTLGPNTWDSARDLWLRQAGRQTGSTVLLNLR